jgi:hypothetical protein
MPLKIGGRSGSQSGALTIQDEGVIVSTSASILNFVGADINAADMGGGVVNIYSPPVAYQPFYNAGGASVSNVSITARNVSDPAPANNFALGGWAAGSSRNCLRTSPLNYTHGVNCSFMNTTTTVEVNVWNEANDGSGTGGGGATLATHTTAAISGNINVTVANINIQITGWATDSDRYQATITVSVDIDAILPNGGRFTVEIIHHNAGTDYTKVQGPIFSDTEDLAASLTGVTIAETPGFVVTRFISGVEYYYLGSDFTIDIADIDNLNAISYPNTQVNCEGSEYGLPALNLAGSDLTGWTNAWDDDNDTYQKTDWEITQTNFFTASTTANVSSRTVDWVNGGWVNSANANILIETHNTANTRLIEYFFYEDWRVSVGSNFDLPNQRGWVSNVNVSANDAIFYNGTARRINGLANGGNFTIYNPNPGSQPDYSASQNATVYLIRQFDHDGTASSGFTLNITGSYTSLECTLAKAWDGTATGGLINWVDMTAGYNAPQWNNGSPLGGTGNFTGGSHYTFGTNNIIFCNNQLYIRIGLSGADSISSLSVTFD